MERQRVKRSADRQDAGGKWVSRLQFLTVQLKSPQKYQRKDNGIRNVAMVLTNITCFKEFLFNREKLDWKIGFTVCKQNLPEKCKKFPAEPHFLATAAKASRSECP